MNQGFPRPPAPSNRGIVIGLAIAGGLVLFLGVVGVMCVAVVAKRGRALALEDAGRVPAATTSGAAAVDDDDVTGPVACAWATSAGMPPSLSWGTHGGDEASCMSRPFRLVGGEIRYFVKGRDVRTVEQLSLVMDVRGAPSSELAQKNLASAFETVMRQAFKKPVPLSVDDTIRKGDEDRTSIAGHPCVMTKTPYVNGVGYEYRVDVGL